MPPVLAATEKNVVATNRTADVNASVEAPMGGVHGVDKKNRTANANENDLLSNDRADSNGNTTSPIAIQNGTIVAKYNELVDSAAKRGNVARPILPNGTGTVEKAVTRTSWQQKLQTSKSAHSVPNTTGDEGGSGGGGTAERRPSLIYSIINKFSNAAGSAPSQALLRPTPPKRDANKIEISAKFQQCSRNVSSSIFAERFKRSNVLERKQRSSAGDDERSEENVPENKINSSSNKLETSTTSSVKYSFDGSVLVDGQMKNAAVAREADASDSIAGDDKPRVDVRSNESKTKDGLKTNEPSKPDDDRVKIKTREDQTTSAGRASVFSKINKENVDAERRKLALEQTTTSRCDERVDVNRTKEGATKPTTKCAIRKVSSRSKDDSCAEIKSVDRKIADSDKTENKNQTGKVNVDDRARREQIETVKNGVKSENIDSVPKSSSSRSVVPLEVNNKKDERSEVRVLKKQNEIDTIAKNPSNEIAPSGRKSDIGQNVKSDLYESASVDVDKTVAKSETTALADEKVVVVVVETKKTHDDVSGGTNVVAKTTTKNTKADEDRTRPPPDHRVQTKPVKKVTTSRFGKTKPVGGEIVTIVVANDDISGKVDTCKRDEKVSGADIEPVTKTSPTVVKETTTTPNLATNTDCKINRNVDVLSASIVDIKSENRVGGPVSRDTKTTVEGIKPDEKVCNKLKRNDEESKPRINVVRKKSSTELKSADDRVVKNSIVHTNRRVEEKREDLRAEPNKAESISTSVRNESSIEHGSNSERNNAPVKTDKTPSECLKKIPAARGESLGDKTTPGAARSVVNTDDGGKNATSDKVESNRPQNTNGTTVKTERTSDTTTVKEPSRRNVVATAAACVPTTVVNFGSDETRTTKSAANGRNKKDEHSLRKCSAVGRASRACDETTESPDRADQNNGDGPHYKLSVSDAADVDPVDGMKPKVKQTRPNAKCLSGGRMWARAAAKSGNELGDDINNPLNVVIVARSSQCIESRDRARRPPTDAASATSRNTPTSNGVVGSDPPIRSLEKRERDREKSPENNEDGTNGTVRNGDRTLVVRSDISENLVRDPSSVANETPVGKTDVPGAVTSPSCNDRAGLNAGDVGAAQKTSLGTNTTVDEKSSCQTVRVTSAEENVTKTVRRVEIERQHSNGVEPATVTKNTYYDGGAAGRSVVNGTNADERGKRSPSNSSVSSTDTITSNYESVASSSYDTATSSLYKTLPPLPKRAAAAVARCKRSASDSVRDTIGRQERNATFFRKSAPDTFLRHGSPIPSTRPGGRVTTGKLVISRSPSPTSSRTSTGIGSMSRSVSPCSRASSLSSGSELTSGRSSTPRRIFPQSPAKAELDDIMNRDRSPIVFGANLSFVIGCKSQIRHSVKSTAAHLDSSTASNYLSTKITDFLKRTDHVMDEWKYSGHRGDDEDDFPKSEQERIVLGKSRSAANIAIKGYTMFSKDRSRRNATRSESGSRSSSIASDLFLNDGDTYSECDELSEMTADLAEEHSTATLATERLDAETSERLRLERELSEVQTKNKSLQQTSERLEMELLYARSDLNGLASDEDEDGEMMVDGGAYKQKYERTLRELEFTKRRLQQQHEDDLEQLVGLKKQLEKKLTDAYEEVEEQRQVVGQWKRKVQKHVSEMNDLRLLLEEQNSRNNLLEKKQRKFDSETQLLHDELRQEKQARERVSREKEVILAEKYTIESNLADVRLELELKDERLRSLQQEIDDLTFGGKEDEVATLRKQKQDCERRLHEQEEELDDLAGQVQILEQAKVRLEMSLEQQKKEAKRESQQREDELEEVRGNAQKKVKALEAQLENEHEERTLLLREKHSLERRLATIAEEGRTEKEGDEAQLQRLKRDLKRTKALLRDAQTMLERAKADNPGKAVIRQLRNQLDDLECARATAVKSKQSLETEVSELQSQLDDAHRQKSEAEDRANAAIRERMDLRTQIEENEEELAEVLKKYRSAVQQLSMDQMALQEQMSLVSELESERNGLKEQLAEMTSKLESRETMDDSSTNVQTKRMELRVKELESKLEFEQTTRARLEVQITRLKETVDKLQTDIAHSRVREQTAQDTIRKVQRNLRELKDEHTALVARDSESTQKRKELEKKFESAEAETAAAKSDLRLALQRIEDLQAAIQGELEDTTSDHSDSDRDSYSSDESIETFLANHKLSPVKIADRSSSQSDSGPRSVEHNVRLNSTSSPAKSSFA